MRATYTTKDGRRYRYYECGPYRGSQNCAHGRVAAIDIEGSLLRNLAPMLGSGLNWETVRETILPIEYDGRRRRVIVNSRDETRLEYEMPAPNRPGANPGEKQPPNGRIPRVSRLLALAIKFENLIREGRVRNHRDLAEAGQVRRARMSQIMRLTELAPEIQEALLFLPKTQSGRDRITEKDLRRIANAPDWDWQRKMYAELAAPL